MGQPTLDMSPMIAMAVYVQAEACIRQYWRGCAMANLTTPFTVLHSLISSATPLHRRRRTLRCPYGWPEPPHHGHNLLFIRLQEEREEAEDPARLGEEQAARLLRSQPVQAMHDTR